jgi:hypothetical protein
MVAEVAIVLIGWFVVPSINELVQAARDYAGKKLSSGKEFKELEAGLDEIKGMVGLEAPKRPQGRHGEPAAQRSCSGRRGYLGRKLYHLESHGMFD